MNEEIHTRTATPDHALTLVCLDEDFNYYQPGQRLYRHVDFANTAVAMEEKLA